MIISRCPSNLSFVLELDVYSEYKGGRVCVITGSISVSVGLTERVRRTPFPPPLIYHLCLFRTHWTLKLAFCYLFYMQYVVYFYASICPCTLYVDRSAVFSPAKYLPCFYGKGNLNVKYLGKPAKTRAHNTQS